MKEEIKHNLILAGGGLAILALVGIYLVQSGLLLKRHGKIDRTENVIWHFERIWWAGHVMDQEWPPLEIAALADWAARRESAGEVFVIGWFDSCYIDSAGGAPLLGVSVLAETSGVRIVGTWEWRPR